MTLKEFLEKYVSPTQYVSVFLYGDDGCYRDTVVYLAFARRVLELDLWSKFLDYEIVNVSNDRESLVIEIKGE